MIWSDNAKEQQPRAPLSPADFQDFRRTTRSFAGIEAMYSFLASVRLRTAAGIEITQASVVTPGMFDLLGRQAQLGRTFAPGETRGVVVISHAYWQRRFGGDPGVIGKALPIVDQVDRRRDVGRRRSDDDRGRRGPAIDCRPSCRPTTSAR